MLLFNYDCLKSGSDKPIKVNLEKGVKNGGTSRKTLKSGGGKV